MTDQKLIEGHQIVSCLNKHTLQIDIPSGPKHCKPFFLSFDVQTLKSVSGDNGKLQSYLISGMDTYDSIKNSQYCKTEVCFCLNTTYYIINHQPKLYKDRSNTTLITEGSLPLPPTSFQHVFCCQHIWPTFDLPKIMNAAAPFFSHFKNDLEKSIVTRSLPSWCQINSTDLLYIVITVIFTSQLYTIL